MPISKSVIAMTPIVHGGAGDRGAEPEQQRAEDRRDAGGRLRLLGHGAAAGGAQRLAIHRVVGRAHRRGADGARHARRRVGGGQGRIGVDDPVELEVVGGRDTRIVAHRGRERGAQRLPLEDDFVRPGVIAGPLVRASASDRREGVSRRTARIPPRDAHQFLRRCAPQDDAASRRPPCRPERSEGAARRTARISPRDAR